MRNQSAEANIAVNPMLELPDKDFKPVVIKMAEQF